MNLIDAFSGERVATRIAHWINNLGVVETMTEIMSLRRVRGTADSAIASNEQSR